MAEGKYRRKFRSLWNKEGNAFIQFLLDAGLDVNALNKYGKTMLSYAALWGHLEMTDFLVQKGADGNVANSDGAKPLHMAAKLGHKDIVKFFLRKGLSADSLDNNNCTPLHYVAECDTSSIGRESYQEIVHLLVDSNADINALNQYGETPLLRAARYYRWSIVELYIKLGANVNCCNIDKWTVLHFSCRNGWLSISRCLVKEYDMDVNARTSKGETPLLIAASRSEREIVELFIDLGARVEHCNKRQWTVLHYSSWIGWLPIVRSLVEGNFDLDLNARTEDGDTPMLLAASDKHRDIVQLLIKLGANVNYSNKNQMMTLLHHACSNGWVDIVEYLVKIGCDINTKDSFGHTPLICAARESNGTIVEYLLQLGAYLEDPDDEGCTVLHYACREGWLEVVRSIVNKLSDINAQDQYEDTPLHYAVRNQHTEIIEHMLKAGAGWNLENYSNQTAFNECIESEHLEGIKLFIETGAYFDSIYFNVILCSPLLREGILQDTTVCTQAVINRFNNVDLPTIYGIPVIAEMLPPVDKLKIASHRNVVRDVAECVNFEIQTKGYCDLLNAYPIFLSNLCLKSLVEYCSN